MQRRILAIGLSLGCKHEFWRRHAGSCQPEGAPRAPRAEEGRAPAPRPPPRRSPGGRRGAREGPGLARTQARGARGGGRRRGLNRKCAACSATARVAALGPLAPSWPRIHLVFQRLLAPDRPETRTRAPCPRSRLCGAGKSGSAGRALTSTCLAERFGACGYAFRPAQARPACRPEPAPRAGSSPHRGALSCSRAAQWIRLRARSRVAGNTGFLTLWKEMDGRRPRKRGRALRRSPPSFLSHQAADLALHAAEGPCVRGWGGRGDLP